MPSTPPTILRRRFAGPDGGLTALVNPGLRDEAGRPYGQLGILDLPADREAGCRLVSEAMAWLAAEEPSIATVLAPINGDAWHDYRLMVEGFDQPPFPGEPRNPSDLPGILEGCGFAPFSEHVTKTLADPAGLVALWQPFAARMRRRGVRYQALAPGELDGALARAHHLSLAVFRDLPLFTPLPEADFRALYAGAGQLLEPGGVTFAQEPTGDDIGLCFAFRLPDRPADLYIKSFGIRSAWQGSGLTAAFLEHVYRQWQERGVTRVHHCLMNSQEAAARFDRGAGVVSRRYRLYARTLVAGNP